MINNVSMITIIIFIITNILFLCYFACKIYKRKYFLSIFNINTYIFIFALLITSYFQFSNEAWGFLGVNNPNDYYYYLDKNIRINCIGLIIFLLIMIYIEFIASKKYFDRIDQTISKTSLSINIAYLRVIFIFSVIAWSILILIAGEIPLFGDRLIFNSSRLRLMRPFYLILNYIISIISSYFAFNSIINKNKKDIVFLCVGIITSLLTGNRGPIVFLILNIFIVFMYYKFNCIKANKYIILSVILALFIGISMSFIRNKDFNISGLGNSIKNEIIYGNTFSDVRDGAFVLKGFEDKYDNYLLGKNYLADIISFIPSSLSEFRETWSYGSFSTKTLFNMENHYGLRGGWFLEPYINFGYLGIIIIAIINGVVMACAERIFWKETIINRDKKFTKKQLAITFIIFIANSMMISSSFNNFYAYIGIGILYFVCKHIDKKSKMAKKMFIYLNIK